MSRKYRKQHVIPKTYLKYFSLNEDGNNLHVFDNQDPHRQEVQIKNSGDRIFWERDYYNSFQFKHPTALEEHFGRSVESKYPHLMSTLKKEEEITDKSIKNLLFLWILSSIYRSPQIRSDHHRVIELNRWLQNFIPDFSEKSFEGIDITRAAKELHLGEFANKERLNSNIDGFSRFISIKRWDIIKSPEGHYWMTSDNPGFLFNIEEDGLHLYHGWNFDKSDCLFFPLSKKYGILIQPYSRYDSIEENFINTPLRIKVSGVKTYNLFNRFTFASTHRLIIAPDRLTCIRLGLELEIRFPQYRQQEK